MSSPGIVFIVGMERCYTTSLAQWLVESGCCEHLVEGIKEPAIFVSDPGAGIARWNREREGRDRWLLDASVANVWSDRALDAIASIPEARVVVCLRNQLDRTVSAYRLARAVFCLPSDESLRHPSAALKYGDAPLRSRDWNRDPLAPKYLRTPIRCRRAYTLVRYSEYPGELASAEQIESCDRDVERLAQQSLPVRIAFEWARWMKTRTFPNPTILLNSCFAAALRRVFSRIPTSRIMVATLSEPTMRARLGDRMPRFLGLGPIGLGLGQHMGSDSMGFDVPAGHIERAHALAAQEFAKDTREVRSLLEQARGIDLSLFEPAALFPAS